MSTPTLAAMLVSLALMAANPQAGAAALMPSQAATQQFRIDFTRANEKEADSMGIRLMARAGYDTRKRLIFSNVWNELIDTVIQPIYPNISEHTLLT